MMISNDLNDEEKCAVRRYSDRENYLPLQENLAIEVKEFYCPVYDGMISQYDCDEISCGAENGIIFNDGLPFLMEIEAIRRKRETCLNCARHKFTQGNPV